MRAQRRIGRQLELADPRHGREAAGVRDERSLERGNVLDAHGLVPPGDVRAIELSLKHLHHHPVQPRRLGPHDLVARHEADVGDRALGDASVGSDEQRLVEPVGLREPREIALPEPGGMLDVGARSQVLDGKQALADRSAWVRAGAR